MRHWTTRNGKQMREHLPNARQKRNNNYVLYRVVTHRTTPMHLDPKKIKKGVDTRGVSLHNYTGCCRMRALSILKNFDVRLVACVCVHFFIGDRSL